MNVLTSTPVAHSDTVHRMPEYAPETLDQYDLQIWHSRYHCPLHTWLSQARVKTNSNSITCYFILYIEYRDFSRASRYSEFSFNSLEEALRFRSERAETIELKSISPKMTSRYPIIPIPLSKCDYEQVILGRGTIP
ncbi:hypothetical protein GZ77_02445 [Endozoicomonas montiporae]|uniref:Uncharacterized protein n=2 Tax=Endozoicomonas montiporae TaxID=1027273 RepID=A0A081NAN8_9GAMM|nr:hypothetical protein [Endozoicomonas montiporae]AMO56804.1 hypothetical protein EZMO1_2754 [Endozoicomonas montiporae CL-33]KEQ15511.1 hypothetical protein GZ77_02445 [Endozoicomonas montiporae]